MVTVIFMIYRGRGGVLFNLVISVTMVTLTLNYPDYKPNLHSSGSAIADPMHTMTMRRHRKQTQDLVGTVHAVD